MTSADASTTLGSCYLPGGPSSSWQKTSFYFKQMSSGLMRMKKMLIINQYGKKRYTSLKSINFWGQIEGARTTRAFQNPGWITLKMRVQTLARSKITQQFKKNLTEG